MTGSKKITMTAAELASRLGVTPARIHNLVKEGMPVARPASVAEFDYAACRAWLDARSPTRPGPQKAEPIDGLLGVVDAAAALGLSDSTVRLDIRMGAPHTVINGRYYLAPQAYATWRRTHKGGRGRRPRSRRGDVPETTGGQEDV